MDLVSLSSPWDIIAFLNEMYIAFDTALSDFDVYKVETIADSYVVSKLMRT